MFEIKKLSPEQRELYNKLKQAEVFLEEARHIYIHKTTKEYFLSVTGVLELIKPKMDFNQIKKGIVLQYKNILNWVHNFALTESEIVNIIQLYTNYKNYRPYTIEYSTFRNEEYKLFKKLKDYSLPEFYNEFLELKNNNPLDRYKPVYLNNNMQVLNEQEIQKLWWDITDVANLYGNLVHTIVEQYILLKQEFVDEELEHKLKEIYDDIKKFLNNLDYKYNSHIFEEYEIDVSFEDFKYHVIFEFEKLDVDLGRVCVPERLLYIKKYSLCGMTDVYVDVDDKFFDIGDHKTNKHFTYRSEYEKKLLGKLGQYDECDYNLYNLQLSIYALVIELVYGKKLRKIWISYYNRLNKNFTYIPLPFLKKEAEYLLELHLKTINARKHKLKDLIKTVPEKYKNHLVREIVRDLKKNTELINKKDKKSIIEHYTPFVKKYLDEQKKYAY